MSENSLEQLLERDPSKHELRDAWTNLAAQATYHFSWAHPFITALTDE